jgi:hypothetical protein
LIMTIAIILTFRSPDASFNFADFVTHVLRLLI